MVGHFEHAILPKDHIANDVRNMMGSAWAPRTFHKWVPSSIEFG